MLVARTPFGNHVEGIIQHSAGEEMIGINAGSIVATVTCQHSGPQWPSAGFKRETVRVVYFATHAEASVSRRRKRPHPQEATAVRFWDRQIVDALRHGKQVGRLLLERATAVMNPCLLSLFANGLSRPSRERSMDFIPRGNGIERREPQQFAGRPIGWICFQLIGVNLAHRVTVHTRAARRTPKAAMTRASAIMRRSAGRVIRLSA